MIVSITNTPREYAWGSTTAIARLLGYEPHGAPEAELWLGTHAGSPAQRADGSGELGDLVPDGLPYLLKVLAAASPLSLQAHPTIEQAREGFARENSEGVALDAPHRNYKDSNHKPELIVALEDGFTALCGFRTADQVRATLDSAATNHHIAQLRDMMVDDASIRNAFTWLIQGGVDVDQLLGALSEVSLPGINGAIVALLSSLYPGDPGIAISLLLNAVILDKGEALYLPAGNIHAYIEGLGMELMASSDNVLRGGLTPKHVDVGELVNVLDFRALPVPYLVGVKESESVTAYVPPIDDFALRHITHDAELSLAGPVLMLCTEGEFAVTGSAAASAGRATRIERGQALFISADEWPLAVAGTGSLFVATTSL
ncbi:MAG: mannose-6-phosphate isomerase, class I [Microbacteriaceae bacterium]